MSKPCKAFVIDPFVLEVHEGGLRLGKAPPIRSVDHGGDYREIYDHLTTPFRKVNTFEACYIDGDVYGDCMYVDEEGLLHDATHFIRVEGFPNPVAGKGMLLGTDEEGYSITPQTSFAALWNRVSIAVGNVEVRLKDVPMGHAVTPGSVSMYKRQVVQIWAEKMGTY